METTLLIIAVVLSLISSILAVLVFSWIRKAKFGGTIEQKELDIIANKIEILKDTGNTSSQILLDWAKNSTGTLDTRIAALQQETRENLSHVKKEVEAQLKDIREGNDKQLEKIRETVNEKVSETLKEKLDISFGNVAKQLGDLQKNLGEMKILTNSVADLNLLLSNNKTRGAWGEVALEMIIAEIFPSELYAKQFSIKKGSKEAVDFVVILPGQSEGTKVYLPIDAKFPTTDYEALLEFRAMGDKAGIEEKSKSLKSAIKKQAKDISTKYIEPPKTTDFALMYLPSEGLYAEVVSIPNLSADLYREYRIILSGPTTIAALMQSLSVGFKTLQIQKNSAEMIRIIKSFSKDFGKLLGEIKKTKEHLNKAMLTIENTEKQSKTVKKSLDGFEAIEASDESSLLDVSEEVDED